MQPNRLFLAVMLVLVLVPVLGVPAQELTEHGAFKMDKFRTGRAELSPDGTVLVACGVKPRGGELKLLSTVTGKEIVTLSADTKFISSLAFSADGKRLVSGSQGPVQVWDLIANKEIASLKGFHDAPSSVALNRDGTKVAAVGGREAKVWAVASGKELASFEHHVPLYSGPGVAFNSDLGMLAARNYQEIDLWDTATGKEKATLSEHRGEVGCLVWSADDKTLIASSTRFEGKDYQWKGDVKLWDVGSAKERATLPGPFGRILALAFSPNGKTLAVLDSPEQYAVSVLKLVEVDTGRQQVVLAQPRCSFQSLRFTPEGKLLVVGTSEDTLRLWEVALPKREVKP